MGMKRHARALHDLITRAGYIPVIQANSVRYVRRHRDGRTQWIELSDTEQQHIDVTFSLGDGAELVSRAIRKVGTDGQGVATLVSLRTAEQDCSEVLLPIMDAPMTDALVMLSFLGKRYRRPQDHAA